MTSFFGQRVVRTAFVVAVFGWGFGFYGPPVFLHAVVQRTGWGLPFVSAAVTLHFLCGALVVARIPRLYARFGVAPVTAAGALVLGAGVVGWGLAAQPWQLILAALMSGAGWVALGAAAVNAIIAPWFVRTRPRALATAYNGASIGGVVFSPLWVMLIAAFGFAGSAAVASLVMIVIVLWLAHAVLRHTPAALGQAPDGDAPGAAVTSVASPLARPLPGKALWRDRNFVTLAGGMALGLFAQIGLIAHLFSLLVPALGAQGSGLLMGLATASAIAGRSLVGWFMPLGADRRVVACLSYAVQICGSVVLILSGGDSAPLLVLGVVLFGAGIGNATSLPPLIAQVEFMKEDLQRAVSLVVALAQAAYAFAPAAFGLLLAFGSGASTPVFVAAAMVQLAAIACFLSGRRRGVIGAAAVTSSR